MKGKAFLDSNILVYAFDTAEKDKHETAKRIVADGILGKQDFAMALQNVNEFFVNITSKAHRPARDAAALAGDLLAKFPCYPADNNTVEYAMSLAQLYKIPFWDAMIAAVMLENSIFTIYTENEKDFSRIPGIKVVNPFRSE